MCIPISTPIVTIAFFSLFRQIKAELTFHNIKLYPYESEEDDEQEQALNESIRVSLGT
jgi:septin 3/9/12